MTTEEKKKWGKLGAIISIVLLVIALSVSAKFTAERYESDVITFDQKMQSVWSIVSQMVKMAGFAPNAFSDTYLAGIKANALRYENDKDGMMKWVQESANQLTPDVHKKFMDIVEKAYAKKAAAQLDKLSISNQYRKFLNGSIRGWFARQMGYPNTKVLMIMNRTIKSEKTAETWATGIEKEPENPFAK